MENIGQCGEELKFLLSVTQTVSVDSFRLDNYLQKGYKIIGVEQMKDSDGLISLNFVVAK